MLIVSALFAVGGVWMIVDGDASGWYVEGFFGLCLLVAVFEPWLPKPDVSCGLRPLDYTRRGRLRIPETKA